MEKLRPAVEEEIKVEDGSGGSGPSNTEGTEDGGTESSEKPKQHVIIDLIPKTEGHSEFRLQTLLEEPNSHKFYCPNCRACIQNIEVIPTDKDPFRCTYCYSFLEFIGCGLVSICKPGPESPKPGPGPGPSPSPGLPIPGPGPSPSPGLPSPGPGPPSTGTSQGPSLSPRPEPGPGPSTGPGLGPSPSPGPGSSTGPSTGPEPVPNPGPGPNLSPGLGSSTGPSTGPGLGPWTGSGPSPGLGPGPSPGPGSSTGPSTGPGLSPWTGPGPSPGPGSSTGPSIGPGLGPWTGPGPSPGPGPGPSPGPGSSTGPRTGPGLGPWTGPGSSPRPGPGPSPGPGSSTGPGLGPRSSQAIPPKKWDILKSIVYGGLIESITSLNIVTSAAGADATTLNILALALASLIGGLFVIGHNIIELRHDIQQPERTSTTTSTGETNNEEQTSRYYQQLGLIENFKRHAAVTVISFLLFGMVAPVTYSFSFLKSDDKDLKLIVVAAASLVCIAMLAIAKAYIQKASSFYGYVKTVLYFVIPGFLASGLSYVVGDLVKKLMEKLGLFDSSSDFTLSLPGTGRIEPRWGFY